MILIIFGLSIFLLYSKSFENSEEDKKSPTGIPENLENDSNGSSESSSSIDGGEGGESSSGEINNENLGNLPDDLYEKPCGFYVKEYSICAGYCPDGECISEGKSCYCKNID